MKEADSLFSIYSRHPWHGVSSGEHFPRVLTAYIEIVPTDTVKYELDKATGILKVDRPNLYSSMCPTLYGFVPQTYCGENVGKFCGDKVGRQGIVGDGDPMDICVFSQKAIAHGGVLLQARPIGGLRMIDSNQADDKIIAVLEDDPAYGAFQDLSDCPQSLLDPLMHYFLTYKQLPGIEKRKVEIAAVYDSQEALLVLKESCKDYSLQFGTQVKAYARVAKAPTEG